MFDNDGFRPSKPPQDGALITLTGSSRIMVHDWNNGQGINSWIICHEYDEVIDDTGKDYPRRATDSFFGEKLSAMSRSFQEFPIAACIATLRTMTHHG
jgi:hypothetical protein